MFVKVSTDGGVGWHWFIQDGCLTSGVVRYSKRNMGYVPEEDNYTTFKSITASIIFYYPKQI